MRLPTMGDPGTVSHSESIGSSGVNTRYSINSGRVQKRNSSSDTARTGRLRNLAFKNLEKSATAQQMQAIFSGLSNFDAKNMGVNPSVSSSAFVPEVTPEVSMSEVSRVVQRASQSIQSRENRAKSTLGEVKTAREEPQASALPTEPLPIDENFLAKFGTLTTK